MRPRVPLFYGWVVVAACFSATLATGEVTWSFGVFFTSLEEEFNWSRHVVSAGYTLLMVGHSVSAIIAGRLADRGAVRPTLLTSTVLGGTAILLCSRIAEPYQYYALFLFIGLGAGATHSIPNSVVQRWFANRPHAGIALATVMTGIGVGALVFAPLFRHIISMMGWRPAFVWAGIGFFLIVGFAGLLTPQHIRSRLTPALPPTSVAETRSPKVVSARRMIVTRQFLVLAAINFAAFLAFQVTVVHLVPYASDIGLSPESAALALGLMGGASVPGRFLSGVIAERFGWSLTLALALLGSATAVLGVMTAAADWMLICAVALFGMCHGMRSVAVMGLLARFFGTAALGEIIGITIATGQVVSAPGPYIAGYWYDLGHSYGMMFVLLAAVLMIGALLVVRIERRAPPHQ